MCATSAIQDRQANHDDIDGTKVKAMTQTLHAKAIIMMQIVHASLIDKACLSKADLVSGQFVIKATPPQLLLLFGQHASNLFLGLGLFLGDIVLALLLKLGALHMYDLLGILSKGGPIQNVQCQLNLQQKWILSMQLRA